ncbi:MAG: NADH-quinone oxidoreductase subunit J [Clostridia bacterium]|nr:NADH-quinone oxidoreductase subunit J [Clostridia bacterium]
MSPDFSWVSAFFYLLATVAILSGLLVVLCRNIMHSVLWLAVCFISIGGIFLTLDAEFLAAVQVMVYAGAVCIMMVFGIMLIKRTDMAKTNLFNRQTGVAAAVVAVMIALCGILSAQTHWDVYALAAANDKAVGVNNIDVLSNLLFSKYVIPFEVAAVLLTAALIGAIVLARDPRKEDEGVEE